ERCAELAVIGLLQVTRVLKRHAQVARDELPHAPIDLEEELAGRRIERVIEVEDPDVGRSKPAPRAKRPCRSRRVAALAHPVHLRAFFLGLAWRPTSVPTPCSVKSSSSTQWGTRPSMMTTASTPASTTSMHPSTLGIMPPEITPSRTNARASSIPSSAIKR